MASPQSEQQLLAQLLEVMKKINSNDHVDIDVSSANFTPTRSFQLYVGVAGTIAGLNEQGVAFSRYFTAGYHPLMMKQINTAVTNATSLAAIYYS